MRLILLATPATAFVRMNWRYKEGELSDSVVNGEGGEIELDEFRDALLLGVATASSALEIASDRNISICSTLRVSSMCNILFLAAEERGGDDFRCALYRAM